jgi:hypothetical protein
VRRGVGDLQGVAVGRRARHRLGRNDGAAADAVLHHDLLVQPLAKPGAEDAGEVVGQAAGLERHDEMDRPVGIFGCGGGRDRKRRRNGKRGDEPPTAGWAKRG